MLWREPENPIDDCYFCLIDIAVRNKTKRKSELSFSQFSHQTSIRITFFKGFTSVEIEESDHDVANDFVDIAENEITDFEGLSSETILLQEDLSNLIRNVSLSNGGTLSFNTEGES